MLEIICSYIGDKIEFLQNVFSAHMWAKMQMQTNAITIGCVSVARTDPENVLPKFV